MKASTFSSTKFEKISTFKFKSIIKLCYAVNSFQATASV